eukprot:6489248-Amphidinium_carterae.1
MRQRVRIAVNLTHTHEDLRYTTGAHHLGYAALRFVQSMVGTRELQEAIDASLILALTAARLANAGVDEVLASISD